MNVTLTDIEIAIIILRNITKATTGEGLLTMSLPNNITLTIDYRGDNLSSRCIQIYFNAKRIGEWKGGDIMVEEIESCLRNKIINVNSQ